MRWLTQVTTRLGSQRRGGVWPALLATTVLMLAAMLTGTEIAPPALAASTPKAASLTLSPTSGPPGTVVTLHGYVPGMTKAPPAYQGITVCIGPCESGFTDGIQTLHYLGDGRFTARFTVPTVPLLTANGPLTLTDGMYRIGYTCVGPNEEGCDFRTQASAAFTVTHSTERPCSAAFSCASLTLTPSRAEPGQEVHVTGHAPLAPLLGGQPFGYNLAIAVPGHPAVDVSGVQESLSGTITGSFRMPALLEGVGEVGSGLEHVALQYQFNSVAQGKIHLPPGITVTEHGGGYSGYEVLTLAPTALEAVALPTWKSLGTLTPAAGETQWSQPLSLTTRGSSTQDFAYCVPGGIRLTQNGGRTFQRVSTDSAALASKSGPFPLFTNLSAAHPSVTCASVLWDPNDPHTFYATFGAENRIYHSAPPFYTVAYVTRNGGESWTPVPVPAGSTEGDFGGMSEVEEGTHSAVAMVFGRQSPSNPQVGVATATEEITTNGGASWQTTHLTCPGSGPCVRFGAMPGMQPGMGSADLQPLVRSTNDGKTWIALTWPTGNLEAQGMVPTGQSELVGLPGNRVAFLDPSSQYPLRISKDGGVTWQAVALPVPPGSAGTSVREYGVSPYAALMWLPNGNLLAGTSPSGGFVAPGLWYVLHPGASTWRLDPTLKMPDVLGRLVIAGQSLYGLGVKPDALIYTNLLRARLP